MSWKKIFAVLRREYLERVRTKAFWIGTLLFPGIFLAMIGFQIALSRKASGDRYLAVVDTTGTFYPQLKRELESAEKERRAKRPNEKAPHWVLTDRPVEGSLDVTKDALRREVVAKKLNAYLVLTPALVARDQAEYYSTTVSEWTARNHLENAFNKVRLRQKISARGLHDRRDVMSEEGGERLIAVARKTRSAEIETYAGLFNYAPALAVTMSAFLFSLAGVPPLGGWYAKLVVFKAVLDAGTGQAVVLGVVAAVNSVIALFYYARVAGMMFFRPAPATDGASTPGVPIALGAAIAMPAVLIVALGIYPQIFARLGELASLGR